MRIRQPDPVVGPIHTLLEEFELEVVKTEAASFVRPATPIKIKIPVAKETWKNLQDLKVYTIIKVNNKAKTITVKTSGIETKISFQTLFEHFVKYTPKTAGDSPPIKGEVWQNIHTSKKATVQNIQDARMGKEIVWQTEQGAKGTTDLKSFVANWRRIKQSNKWFLGINFGKKEKS